MELPFTLKQFFDVFEAYNMAILPVQLFAYLFASIAAVCVIRRSRLCDHYISLTLAALWFWNGAVYHIRYFSTINEAAYLFGGMFIVQSLLFIWYGNIRGRLKFGVERDLRGLAGCVLLLLGMFVYTDLAIFAGHQWPRSAMFGVAPCPTTIYTFGMLLWTSRRAPGRLLIIPTLWALIGSSAVFLLGIKEDICLLIAAAIAVPLLLTRGRDLLGHWRQFGEPLSR